MQLDEFNKLGREEAATVLSKCCGSTLWVDGMMAAFPFSSKESLLQKAEEVWFSQCGEMDWLEAFTHHPKIGDLKGLEEKFAATKVWAGAEQAGVQQADKPVLEELAKGNEDYEKKFGFIFIVCATGKTAGEMLALLQNRLPNQHGDEIKIAVNEQSKITVLRLQKLLS